MSIHPAFLGEVPEPHVLLAIREWLGLSQTEFATALGFGPNGDSVVRSWEKGDRDGKPFRPTPPVAAHIRCLVVLTALYRADKRGSSIREVIAQVLPESLK